MCIKTPTYIHACVYILQHYIHTNYLLLGLGGIENFISQYLEENYCDITIYHDIFGHLLILCKLHVVTLIELLAIFSFCCLDIFA